jgi:hypothetical protein
VPARQDAILGRLYGPGAEKGRRMLEEALRKKMALPMAGPTARPSARPTALPENEQSGWLLNYAWIINTPLEMGLAPEDKARRALEKMSGPQFTGPWGMYLSGLFQDQAMTISTGVMAAAQARYGYADRALELLEKMFSAFNMASPGCIAEMLPDYGCFVQAWTAYAVMVPIVNYFFGIRPQAAEGLILVSPCMPRAWPRASLERVPVLDGELSIEYCREQAGDNYRIDFTGKTPVFFEYLRDGKICRVPAGPPSFEITF